MARDGFVAQGFVASATMKAKEEKGGAVVRTLEVRVLIPEPAQPDALTETAKDVAGLVGKRLVVRGETVQVSLPLDDRSG